MKKIKKINKEHRADGNELKSQIWDFKAVKMTLTSTEISHAKTWNDQKGIIDKLNNDIRHIQTRESETLWPHHSFDERKGNCGSEVGWVGCPQTKRVTNMCQTSFGKRKGCFSEDHSGKVEWHKKSRDDPPTQTGDVHLQHGAESEVAQKDFRNQRGNQTKKLLEQRSRYANVSNTMSQISPFQNSGFHSKNCGGDIRNAMVVQNGGTFPNVRVTTTACVTDCLCLRLQNIVPNNSLILSTRFFVVFWMMIRICHHDKENVLMEIKNLGNRPSRNNDPRRRYFDNQMLVSRRIRYQMDGSPISINFQARIVFLCRDGGSCLFTRRSVSEKPATNSISSRHSVFSFFSCTDEQYYHHYC
jgi:hypothetical protein